MLIATAALLLAGCRSEERDLPVIRTEAPFRVDGTLAFQAATGDTVTTINIEIADTDRARATGMMGRRGLPPRSGMLFIMDEVDTNGFWMKNTPLPLDIIFVGPDSQIINIVERTTPYSEETILPAAPKKYVVEVRGGFSELAGISENMRISWQRNATAP